MDTSDERYILTAIVPVSSMAGRLNLLFSWIPRAISNQIKVVLVHDMRDEATSAELKSFVSEINVSSLVLIEGMFGAPGIARNAGFSYIESNWVAYWDSDDLPHVEEIVSNIKSLQNPQVSVLIGAFEVVDVSRKFEITEHSFVGNPATWIHQLHSMPGLWRFVIKTSLITPYSFSDLRMGEDQLLIESLLEYSQNFGYFNRVAYSYYIGNTFQTTRNSSALKDLEPLVLKSFDLFKLAQADGKRLLMPFCSRQLLSAFKYLGVVKGTKIVIRIFITCGFKGICDYLLALFTHLIETRRISK